MINRKTRKIITKDIIDLIFLNFDENRTNRVIANSLNLSTRTVSNTIKNYLAGEVFVSSLTSLWPVLKGAQV
jgi:DNA-binding Lrp family transcriptional regulator